MQLFDAPVRRLSTGEAVGWCARVAPPATRPATTPEPATERVIFVGVAA